MLDDYENNLSHSTTNIYTNLDIVHIIIHSFSLNQLGIHQVHFRMYDEGK